MMPISSVQRKYNPNTIKHTRLTAYGPQLPFQINLVPVSLFLQSDMLAFLLLSKYAIFTTISGLCLSIRKVFFQVFLGLIPYSFKFKCYPFKERSFLTTVFTITYMVPHHCSLTLFLHCGHHYLIFSACPCACLFS